MMTDSAPLAKDISSQLAICAASEAIGTTVAIGSVLLARKALPGQTARLERLFSRIFAKWHGVSPETMAGAGVKATDFMLMNLGGAANMASQFALHRLNTPEEEKLPLGEEALRVLSGRMAGTIGAASALTLAEHHAGGALRRAEQAVAHHIPAVGQRIPALLLSSFVQSAGAIGPSVTAQLLFDRLVKPKQDQGKAP